MRTSRLTLCLGFTAIALTIAVPASADVVTKKKTKVVQKDRDADVAVSTTRTTSFTSDGRTRDVVESRAEERRDVADKHWTVAPMLGWGSNGYGLGVGARAGYTFSTPIYVGANFMYHVGTGEPQTPVYYPSAEVGYDIGVGSVLLRPYGGMGALVRSGNTPTSSTGVFYPGFTAHWLVPRSPAFLGGDARILIPFDSTPALAVVATTGLNF